MLDEYKLSREADRAVRAKALLDNELIAEAFKGLEDGYIAFWRSTAANDEKAREKAYIAINVIGKVREHLETIIANGALAQADLNRIHEDTERKKRFGWL